MKNLTAIFNISKNSFIFLYVTECTKSEDKYREQNMFKCTILPRFWVNNGQYTHLTHWKHSRSGRTFLQSDKNFEGDSARKVCHNIWNANYVGKQGQKTRQTRSFEKFPFYIVDKANFIIIYRLYT